jgi:tRNA pseudouridine55 synthase
MPALLNGFLVMNKPKNWTSFDVIAKVRSITGIRDIGHAGTLDPFATGVLVLAINRARFLIDRVQNFEKVYRGVIRLGQTSDTDDVDGSKKTVEVSTQPDEKAVTLALTQLTGKIKQLPPTFSALKLQGRRMYALARKGISFERKPREVMIHELKLLAYDYPTIDIEARVGSGTYIRAIARDIGERLKTGGFLEKLIRDRVGPFTLGAAHSIDDVQKGKLSDLVEPLEVVLGDLPRLVISASDIKRLVNGESIKAPTDFSHTASLENLAIVDLKGTLLLMARYDREAHQIKSKKLFDARQEH